MLNVTIKLIMLGVIWLIVVMFSVVASFQDFYRLELNTMVAQA